MLAEQRPCWRTLALMTLAIVGTRAMEEPRIIRNVDIVEAEDSDVLLRSMMIVGPDGQATHAKDTGVDPPLGFAVGSLGELESIYDSLAQAHELEAMDVHESNAMHHGSASAAALRQQSDTTSSEEPVAAVVPAVAPVAQVAPAAPVAPLAPVVPPVTVAPLAQVPQTPLATVAPPAVAPAAQCGDCTGCLSNGQCVLLATTPEENQATCTAIGGFWCIAPVADAEGGSGVIATLFIWIGGILLFLIIAVTCVVFRPRFSKRSALPGKLADKRLSQSATENAGVKQWSESKARMSYRTSLLEKTKSQTRSDSDTDGSDDGVNYDAPSHPKVSDHPEEEREEASKAVKQGKAPLARPPQSMPEAAAKPDVSHQEGSPRGSCPVIASPRRSYKEHRSQSRSASPRPAPEDEPAQGARVSARSSYADRRKNQSSSAPASSPL